MAAIADLPPRLQAKIAPDAADCWLWTASKRPDGYGQVFSEGRPRPAHRVVYESLLGPVPGGLPLDHLCRVRHCVNPEHLEPVSARENILRGISPVARNAVKTHCPLGHPLSGDNVRHYTPKSGGTARACKKCIYLASVRYRERKRAARQPIPA